MLAPPPPPQLAQATCGDGPVAAAAVAARQPATATTRAHSRSALFTSTPLTQPRDPVSHGLEGTLTERQRMRHRPMGVLGRRRHQITPLTDGLLGQSRAVARMRENRHARATALAHGRRSPAIPTERLGNRFASAGLAEAAACPTFHSAVKHLVPALLVQGRGRAPGLQVRPLRCSFLEAPNRS